MQYTVGMQHLFTDTRILDNRAREKFSITEDSMMELAAEALEQRVNQIFLQQNSNKEKNILILAGSGNNGGDGYALARRLKQNSVPNKYITVCQVAEAKSEQCVVQKNRAERAGVLFCKPSDVFAKYISVQNVQPPDIIVDCIFGSGFHGLFSPEIKNLVCAVNKIAAYKIACDVPSGLDQLGNTGDDCFYANETITMGAQKICLYSDKAKDVVGKITVANLGVSRQQFEGNGDPSVVPDGELLEPNDMKLPHRKFQNVNKGSFGHTAIVVGEKIGAAVIAGSSAFRFGSGLVTLVGRKNEVFCGEKIVLDEDGQPPLIRSEAIVPYDIMCSEHFPANTTAVGMGMGLGRNEGATVEPFAYLIAHPEIPCVLDADAFYSSELPDFLQVHTNCVLTPHPKEFVSLLDKCGIGSYSVAEAVSNRIDLVKKFCSEFPGVVLLLKGSVVLIGLKGSMEQQVHLYFNPYGTNALAKGGSGDVLAGMIASLLAQQYVPLDAAISASLAHALASTHAPCDFALTPFSLMKLVAEL